MLSHLVVLSARSGEALAVRRCRAQWADGRDDLPPAVLQQLGHALVRSGSSTAASGAAQARKANEGKNYDFTVGSATRQPVFRLTTASIPTTFGDGAGDMDKASEKALRAHPPRSRGKGKTKEDRPPSANGDRDANDSGVDVPLDVHPTTLSFVYRRVAEGSLYLVAVSRYNMNTAAAFELLMQTEDLIRAYCHTKGGLKGPGGDLTEKKFEDKKVLAFELLEEVIDWGWPQHAGLDSIKPFIFQKTLKGQSKAKKDADLANKITVQATGAIPWRNETVRHKHNEIFIDVIEDVNLMFSHEGKVLSAHVSGKILLKVFLSGMPECKFGLNDRAISSAVGQNASHAEKGKAAQGERTIDNCTFHQCVRLGKFEADRTISFIPPEGEFQLMTYRTSAGIATPFKIIPIVKEHNKRRIEYNVTLKSLFKAEMRGKKVIVKIPVPENVAQAKIYCQKGSAKYTPEHTCITWKIRNIAGQKEYILAAEVLLADTGIAPAPAGKDGKAEATLSPTATGKKAKRQRVTTGAWTRPPISVSFSVPQFTATGLEVKFLKVLERKLAYNAVKFVRYHTQSDDTVLFRI